jgi:hypothetical protein
MLIVGLDVGIRNLSICRIERDSTNAIVAIEDWKLIDCAPEKNATKLSIEEGVRLVVETLEENTSFFENVDVLAIESQPCGRVATSNLKMKVISHGIQTWAILRYPEMKTIFVNPKNKLTREYCGDLLQLEGGDAAVKARYKKHKQMAVAACGRIVEGFPEWKSWFESHRKKDDVADALLLATVADRKKVRKRKKKETKVKEQETKKKKTCSDSSQGSPSESSPEESAQYSTARSE